TSPARSDAIEIGTGMPSARVVMMPNCQPPSAFSPSTPSPFGDGTFQKPLTTRLRLTSKSDRPLLRLRSYQGSLTESNWKVSPAVLPDESSIDLLHVNDASSWNPWLKRLSTRTSMALYHDRDCHMVLYMMLLVVGFTSRAACALAVNDAL